MDERGLVRLRLITHNARLVDTRKERGLTQSVMAEKLGMPHTRLHRIETLRTVPTQEDICQISCFLEKPTDYLFPEELLTAVSRGVFGRRKVELGPRQVLTLADFRSPPMLTDGGLEEMERGIELVEPMRKAIATLEPREQRVISLRFGLEDGRAKTLEEIGPEFHVTRERIRQIESKALRKLRRPRICRQLKDYLD